MQPSVQPHLLSRLMDALECQRCAQPFGGTDIPRRCTTCGSDIARLGSSPVLLKDPDAVDRVIAEAKASGLREWYEAEQSSQLSGPYRHHLARRIAYLRTVAHRFRPAPVEDTLGVDLGCGDGNNLGWLRQEVGLLVASDYNVERLRRAESSGHPDVTYLADVTSYPTRDETFDLVLLNHVLEHIPDDAAALREVRRVLRPGGTFILGVPNEGAVFWRLAYRLQPETRKQTDHVHFYTAATIRERVTDAGFRVLEERALGWGVPHWSLDAMLRNRRTLEWMFEAIGSAVIPSQATSLYLVLSR